MYDSGETHETAELDPLASRFQPALSPVTLLMAESVLAETAENFVRSFAQGGVSEHAVVSKQTSQLWAAEGVRRRMKVLSLRGQKGGGERNKRAVGRDPGCFPGENPRPTEDADEM